MRKRPGRWSTAPIAVTGPSSQQAPRRRTHLPRRTAPPSVDLLPAALPTNMRSQLELPRTPPSTSTPRRSLEHPPIAWHSRRPAACR